jgi:hypothetical protein
MRAGPADGVGDHADHPAPALQHGTGGIGISVVSARFAVNPILPATHCPGKCKRENIGTIILMQ